jgi:hypothetical protein
MPKLFYRWRVCDRDEWVLYLKDVWVIQFTFHPINHQYFPRFGWLHIMKDTWQSCTDDWLMIDLQKRSK